jgi:hypothetical protein
VLYKYVPESPKWLLMQTNTPLTSDTLNRLHKMGSSTSAATDMSQGSNTSAVNAVYQHEMYGPVSALLRTMRADDHDIDEEITELLNEAKAEMQDQGEGGEVTWKDVFAYKKGMIVGIVLMFFQVCCIQVFTSLPFLLLFFTTCFNFIGGFLMFLLLF